MFRGLLLKNGQKYRLEVAEFGDLSFEAFKERKKEEID